MKWQIGYRTPHGQSGYFTSYFDPPVYEGDADQSRLAVTATARRLSERQER